MIFYVFGYTNSQILLNGVLGRGFILRQRVNPTIAYRTDDGTTANEITHFRVFRANSDAVHVDQAIYHAVDPSEKYVFAILIPTYSTETRVYLSIMDDELGELN